MPRYRIVFMGNPNFAIPALQKLVKTHDVCAVYTQPDRPAGRGMKSTPVPVAAYAADRLLLKHLRRCLSLIINTTVQPVRVPI